MNFSDRFYWFRRNLLAFLLLLIFLPFLFISRLLYHSFILFKCDGSQVIEYPWNWTWWY